MVIVNWAVVQGLYHLVRAREFAFSIALACGHTAHQISDHVIFTTADPDENIRQFPCEHCIRGLHRNVPIPVDISAFPETDAVVQFIPENEPPPVPVISPTKPRRRNLGIVWPQWDARKLVESLGLDASHVEMTTVALKGKSSHYDYSMQPTSPKPVKEPIEVTLKFTLTGPEFEKVRIQARMAAASGSPNNAVMLGPMPADSEEDDPFEDDQL